MTIADARPQVIAVVPAAGSGSRMLSACPKQYLTVNGKTILEHTLSALLAHPRVTQVIVALSAQDAHFKHLPIAADPRIKTVVGGDQRADSVLAALQAAGSAEWVMVHDAARPCLHPDDLTRLLTLIDSSPVGGILATPASDTIKRVQSGGSQAIDSTVDREALWHAMTPQLFPLTLLRACLERALREGATVTDEASALEFCGYHPELVNGRRDNLKVTRPEDLALAGFYLNQIHNEENA